MNEIAYGSREEWLALRRGYIGGSDAAAVLGLDEYKSPYRLWAEKTGKVPGFEGNTTTRVGAYLEQLVADMWSEETGKKVRKKNRILVNPDYPFACADVDRLVVGEKALLEIKTTNSFPVMRRCRGGEFPERWYCQMMHYMAVTGCEKAYLAVLINCREMLTYELERDEDEIKALMEAEADFWKHVENDEPPDIDGSDATAEALETIYAESVPGEVELFGRETVLDRYMELRQRRKELDDQIGECENIIKEDLGDNERGYIGGYKVSWKTQERKTFDVKGFAEARPDMDLSAYYRTSSSRPFRVTAKKAS
jgi:putative phage-type endonuclease